MNPSAQHPVRALYERYPYPPIPWFALPRTGQDAENLRYERGTGAHRHDGIRILIAGAGTFEALLVAELHPDAREVVAVDLSARSLSLLKRRLALARASRALLHPWRKKPAPVQLRCSDIEEVCAGIGKGQHFDYIVASNVLHHLPDPAHALQALASVLRAGGALRLVTYPKMSRHFMRATSEYLRSEGLSFETAKLVKKARAAIEKLPKRDPRRLTFECQRERFTETGIRDAFFHPCENPLAPLEWFAASTNAGLTLREEMQGEASRSSFLAKILPQTTSLNVWERLQILDDLMELSENPILWLAKEDKMVLEKVRPNSDIRDFTTDLPNARRRADILLRKCGSDLDIALSKIRQSVSHEIPELTMSGA